MAKKAAITVAMLMRIFSNIFFLFLNRIALLSSGGTGFLSADKPGEVVIQTYQPEHYSIVCAARNDYKSFYEQEILIREMLQYPPISNILGVLVLSENESSADNLAKILADKMKLYHDVTVLGPTPAAISKAKDVYRRMVYGKCTDYKILCSVKNSFEEFMQETESFKDCRLNFEFNCI